MWRLCEALHAGEQLARSSLALFFWMVAKLDGEANHGSGGMLREV